MEIKATKNGPYLVPGPVTYTDAEGHEHTAEGKVIALCRCGHSANKPFCDSAHRKMGFEAEEVVLKLS
ncbi:MAG TPA: CDGSH iron-sulfur domain-containing protein [Chloroflexi bacterium]|nr:CDGSH iron-sulfur domain-containing protein [Chloroflexota bacterium]